MHVTAIRHADAQGFAYNTVLHHGQHPCEAAERMHRVLLAMQAEGKLTFVRTDNVFADDKGHTITVGWGN